MNNIIMKPGSEKITKFGILKSVLDSDSNHLFNDEYYLVSGNTIRNIKHVCIYKNGKLFHDPHPSQQGLISETSIHTLRKINYND